MAIIKQKEIRQIKYNADKQDIVVVIDEYLVDGENKYKVGGDQTSFMPGQIDEMKAFTGRAEGLELDIAEKVWPEEVVAKHKRRIEAFERGEGVNQ